MPAAKFQLFDSCVSLSTRDQEGSMDSLYEAVQSSSDGPPQPIPSRSSSRTCSRSCSRSCSPAVLLDDNTKWRGSGRSISMVRGTETFGNVHTHTCYAECEWWSPVTRLSGVTSRRNWDQIAPFR